MYTGHAAIATLVKGRRPSLPLALLVPAAFGPDWIDILSHVVHHPNPEVSHSIVSVVVCALLLTAACAAVWRRAVDALLVGATYASHWLADFVTGLKPTWPNGPSVGLRLYTSPRVDFVVESALIVVCWLSYRASLRPEVRNSILAWLMPIGLIVMQAVFALLRAPALS